MDNETTVRLDPERLKRERGEVDLGSDRETEHDHVGREPGRAPNDPADDSMHHPTAGATPPAR